MPVYVNNSGIWTQAQEVYVNDSGTWKACKDVLVNDAGTWKSALYSAGSQNYTTAGSYSFTVPAGVYTITATIVGGGGGGGGSNSSGDWWTGGGGGSGGYINAQSYSVTPNETLTIDVGDGGEWGSQYFNSWYNVNPNNAYVSNALAGGSSSIKRGATTVAVATGGNGGLAGNGACDGNAAGGSPNGVQGAQRGGLCYGYGYSGTQAGGDNGSGYGKGGDTQRNVGNAKKGQSGAVLISW